MTKDEKISAMYQFLRAMMFWKELNEHQVYTINELINKVDEK